MQPNTMHTGSTSEVSTSMNSDISLKTLFNIIWRGKWWLIGTTFTAAVVSIIIALSLPDIYAAETKLSPSEEAQGGGLGRMAGQLGGLASLAGVNIGTQQADQATKALEILQSRNFLAQFVENRNILLDLMAVDYWDPVSGEIEYDPELFDVSSETWVREVAPPKQRKPTSWEYVDELRNRLTLGRDEMTGTITLIVEHESPIVATNWVNWLVQDINNEMRRRDIREAQLSIEYLEQQMQETRLASMQQVFYQLMEQQIQTTMLANVRPEYVFQILDAAVIPEQRAKPARALIVIVGTFLGGLVAFLLLFVLYVVRLPNSQ